MYGVVPFGNGFKNSCYILAEEHRYNCGRSFSTAKAAVVARGGNGNSQQILVLIHRFDYGAHKEKELLVAFGLSSGFKQIFAGIGGKRPVVMLSASVDSAERLFMKKAGKTVAFSHLLHNFHCKLVVVGGKVDVAVPGSKLVLTWGNLVVLCFGINAKLPKLRIKIVHKFGNPRAQGAEIVILHFLTLWRL